MSTVVDTIYLECTQGSSSKFYLLEFVLSAQNVLTWKSSYGAIGATPKQGLVSKLNFQMDESIQSGRLTTDVNTLVREAEKLVNSKLKKGYQHASGKAFSLHTITESVKRLITKGAATPKPAPFLPDVSQCDTQDVEIISIANGLIHVASVLADYSYKKFGIATNPSSKSVRVGEDVKVAFIDEQLVIV